MRILVVDDEVKVGGFLKRGLEEEGHAVDLAHDGEEGLSRALAGGYELLILDLMLPRRDGLEVCQALRQAGVGVFILMLSARGETADRVVGLRHGADDYLAKPFAFEELVARVDAAARRIRQAGPVSPALSYGDLRVDLVARTVMRGERPVSLTNREFDLLICFLRHPDQVLGREQLAREVWGMDFDPGTNVVDVYVTYLRKKLEKAGARMIHTQRGEGYRLGLAE